MSSMKQYLNSFRVNAGLDPDDRVLAESALAEDNETNEMERKLMEALESAAKGSGKDDWSYYLARWEEEDEYYDGPDPSDYESVQPPVGKVVTEGRRGRRGYTVSYTVVHEVPIRLAAARPSVIRRKDGGFTVVIYLFGSKQQEGKVLRNMSSLAAATKMGMPKSALKESTLHESGWTLRGEPPLDPPDPGPDPEERDYDYGDSDVPEELEEMLNEHFSYNIMVESIPNLIKKTFPQMKLENSDSETDGESPNHKGWFVGYLKP